MGGNNRHVDPLAQPAASSLVDWWVRLVGCGKGGDPQEQLYHPAEALLERLNQDVPEAKRLIEAKRNWMLAEKDWTPKWLSGVVPSILADLDRPSATAEADTWGSDVLVME